MSARPWVTSSVFVMGVLLLAGCTSPSTPPATTTPSAKPSLQYFDHPGLGPILADPRGWTLYVFTNDDPGKSNCYAQCATNWPPYTVDEVPNAPSEIAGELSLVSRTDGKMQLAYRERPLYYWASDTKAGDVTGDGVNAVWFVVRKPPTDTGTIDGRGEFEVTTEDVTYFQSTSGFYAAPKGAPSPTGIVMIHEWWGLNEHIRDTAEVLATYGYAVLAVDLFKGQVATTSQEAQAQVQAMDQQEAIQNMQAAADLLRTRGAQEVASLGWCFGGGQSLQFSLSGEELVATVIYYGQLVTDETELEPIDWPVLGIFGEKDQVISVANVRAFERALGNLSVEKETYIYPDVGHTFANPSGDAWAPEEANDAWARLLIFLARHTLAVD